MSNWETSRTLLERMAIREEKLTEIRKIEDEWYNLDDLSSPEAYRLMVEWTKQQIETTGARGIVIGVSGGVDSTLGALLAKDAAPDKTIALMIPSGTNGEDAADARKIIEVLQLPAQTIDIEPIVNVFINTVNPVSADSIYGNTVSRIRNAVMYARANADNLLVLGTGDLDEAYIGYSTKGTTSDLFVTNGLHKWEVKEHVKRELGRYDAELTERIISKPSTPGYKKGHNAEDEIGISYNRIGSAIDLILNFCDVHSTGILPKNVREFEAEIEQNNLKPEDILHVEKLIISNYHKGFGSPSLWRSR
ncbi:MAG: NAD(+) synthase [Firmicutes bacterium]|nr:NAD(+) synthase [Bacillota bacterium]